MKLINLTPHPVTFVTENGGVILELPGCPNPPRAQETRETHGEITESPLISPTKLVSQDKEQPA